MKKIKDKNNFSTLLILLGFFLFFILLIFRFVNQRKLSFDNTPDSVISTKPKPLNIHIDGKIDLDIVNSQIVNGVWQVSDTKANFLTSSAAPGEAGNIVIYAHNKKNMFGPLLWVNLGDKIIIKNEKGETFEYLVNFKSIVSPDEIEYVSHKNEETLTLYTCTGFMDNKRFIVTAYPIK